MLINGPEFTIVQQQIRSFAICPLLPSSLLYSRVTISFSQTERLLHQQKPNIMASATATLKASAFLAVCIVLVQCSLGQPTTSFCVESCEKTCAPSCNATAISYCNLIKSSALKQCQDSCTSNCDTCSDEADGVYNSCMANLTETPAYKGCWSSCNTACINGCCNRGCL